MTMVTEKIVALNKSQVAAGLEVFQAAIRGWEQLLELNAQAGNALVRETLEQGRALLSMEPTAAWQYWTKQLVGNGVARWQGYLGNLHGIVVGTAATVGETLEQKLLDAGREWTEMVEAAAVSAPGGHSEAAVSAVRSAMENASAVIEGISKAAKQVAEYADSTVNAAATATAEAAVPSAGNKVR